MVTALLVGACGDQGEHPTAGDILERASERFAQRGELALALRTSRPLAAGTPSEVLVRGPFAVADDGRIELFDAVIEQRRGGPESLTARITFVGGEGMIRCNGRRWLLGPDDNGELERTVRLLGRFGNRVWAGAPRWLTAAAITDGPRSDGQDTWRITGTIDFEALLASVEAALEDPELGLAPAVDGAVPRLAEALGPALERAVKSDRIELLIGKDDGILRRALVSADVNLTDELARSGITLRPGHVGLALLVGDVGMRQDVDLPNQSTDQIGSLDTECP